MTALKEIADFFLSESGLFWGYTIILTVVTFIAYAIDKSRAKNNAWRTSESTLLLLAFVGGAVGAFLGMILCRHKIRKKKFSLTVPFLALLQIAFIIFVYRNAIISLIK
ncbi:MAG: DUF1294 domain-containing protein [Ruminococcaceae bacterium]|nr:DUF1294 domain-containing protein [Oscillospiraceae bacterium]